MREKVKLTYDDFKKEFLEIFREYMVNKTGAVAKNGDINTFYKPHKTTENAIDKMLDFSEKYPEHYDRISEEDWTL